MKNRITDSTTYTVVSKGKGRVKKVFAYENQLVNRGTPLISYYLDSDPEKEVIERSPVEGKVTRPQSENGKRFKKNTVLLNVIVEKKKTLGSIYNDLMGDEQYKKYLKELKELKKNNQSKIPPKYGVKNQVKQ